MHPIQEMLWLALQPYLAAPTWQIAFSGGLDSTVLLHAALQLKQGGGCPPLRAVHIHHGMSPHADAWEAQAKHLCLLWGIPFHGFHVDEKPPLGESHEAFFRSRRYALLEQSLQPGDCILSAHHQDDQAETLLLQLFRGAGPLGLSAMPRVRPLGRGWLVRPLLDVPRASLLQYAQDFGLSWIEDESNQETRFDRNFLRHEILPLLRQRWPMISERLSKASHWQADASLCILNQAEKDEKLVSTQWPHCLSLPALRELPMSRQRHVLRHWLSMRDLPIPSEPQLANLLQSFFSAKPSRAPELSWSIGPISVVARRYREYLYVSTTPLPVPPRAQVTDWMLSESLPLTEQVSIWAEELFSKARLMAIEEGYLQCVWRPQGDRAKKYFQSAGIPPWWRPYIPLFYAGQQWMKPGRWDILLERLYAS